MIDEADLPTLFDADLVDAIAEDYDVPTDRLTALLAEHQSGIADLPGVENLVYEWRRQFDATVVKSTEDAYYVAAPPWVWEEFADALDATDAEAAALASVHARHLRARVDESPEGDQYSLVVLDRSA